MFTYTELSRIKPPNRISAPEGVVCGSCALIQLSRESGSQLVNMAGYHHEVILPIVVLLTVVARVSDMIFRYRRNQLLRAARLRRFRMKLVTAKLARQMLLRRRLIYLLADRETNRPARDYGPLSCSSAAIAESRQTERSHWLIRILIHLFSRIRIRELNAD